MQNTYPYIIKKIEVIEDIKIFYLYPKEKKLIFRPGQFCCLYLEKPGKILTRAYSIASSPKKEYIRLIIKMVKGKLTSLLDKLKIGDKVFLIGPFGNMIYNNEEKIALFAGGTGIAPMISILEYIDKDKVHEIVFFSNKKTIPMEKFLSKFNTKFTLTESKKSGKEFGRINKEMVIKYIPSLKDYVVFICGPKGFANAMYKIAKDLKAKKIMVESWG